MQELRSLIQISQPTPLSALNDTAARALQSKLCNLGLLDPLIGGDLNRPFGPVATADGMIGTDTRAALQEFCRLAQGDLTYIDRTITPEQVAALDEASPDHFLEIDTVVREEDGPQTRLAKQLAAYMLDKGYWIARSPFAYNIVYTEGMNPDGSENEDRPNEWNDRRMVFAVINGQPKMLVNDQATTEPGKFYVLHPIDQGKIGAARIAFGQYKAWRTGLHRGVQPALVQKGPLRIHRDVDKNFARSGRDKLVIGDYFHINQHTTNRSSVPVLVDKFSAGCLVGRRYDWHLSFLKLVQQDFRYQQNPSYMFMSTIIAGDALLKHNFASN